MLMADVAIWVSLFVGLMVVLPAVWLLFGALWPSAIQRAQERIPRKPWSTFFIGLGMTVAVTLLVGVLGQSNVAPVAAVLSAFGLGWSMVGVSALARHVGTRLSSPGDPAWKPHLRGGIVLALSFLVPFLGWMLLFPIALILGMGATTIAVFRRKPAPEPVPAPILAKPVPAKEPVLSERREPARVEGEILA